MHRILETWLDVPDRLTVVANRLGELRDMVERSIRREPVKPSVPPAFVCMLAEGRRELFDYEPPLQSGGRRPPVSAPKRKRKGSQLLTCGATLILNKPGEVGTLDTTTHVPLRNVRVTVFTDLARVSIQGIFYGTDLVTVALGECPVGRFSEWLPGVKLRIPCQLRDENGLRLGW